MSEKKMRSRNWRIKSRAWLLSLPNVTLTKRKKDIKNSVTTRSIQYKKSVKKIALGQKIIGLWLGKGEKTKITGKTTFCHQNHYRYHHPYFNPFGDVRLLEYTDCNAQILIKVFSLLALHVKITHQAQIPAIIN